MGIFLGLKNVLWSGIYISVAKISVCYFMYISNCRILSSNKCFYLALVILSASHPLGNAIMYALLLLTIIYFISVLRRYIFIKSYFYVLWVWFLFMSASLPKLLDIHFLIWTSSYSFKKLFLGTSKYFQNLNQNCCLNLI